MTTAVLRGPHESAADRLVLTTGTVELSAGQDCCAANVQIVLLASGPLQKLGVEPDQAAVRFGEEAKAPGAWAGRRLLWIGDDPAFELTYWCGTCPITFERLKGSTSTLSIPELENRLSEGLDLIDQDVLARFSELLPADTYLPMLMRIQPQLVVPVGNGDYFANEQVTTWGIDGFWGLPESPHTPYYRTFQTPVRPDAHLYEFVVPMVPPNWNDRKRVQGHADRLMDSSQPTVVALSTLDISQPAMDNDTSDYYQHWALTHFVLDGHHKLEAAARAGRPLQILALIARGASLATDDDVARLPVLLAQEGQTRTAS